MVRSVANAIAIAALLFDFESAVPVLASTVGTDDFPAICAGVAVATEAEGIAAVALPGPGGEIFVFVIGAGG